LESVNKWFQNKETKHIPQKKSDKINVQEKNHQKEDHNRQEYFGKNRDKKELRSENLFKKDDIR